MVRIIYPTIGHSEIVRPTLVEVDLDRITANYLAILEHAAPAQVMPVLKANAYGHGMVEVARHLVKIGAGYLGVAVLEEGILLRDEGIYTPILVMGGIMGNQIPYFLQYGLTITASSIDKLEQINRTAGEMGVQARVHLKIDTGMERIGVHYYNAGEFLERSLNCDHCEIEGIYSHFANSDMADLGSARLQLERFLEVLQFYDNRGIKPPIRHIANSGAILQLPESRLDMVRPGIMLYGVYPSEEAVRSVAVQPALSWKSNVVYFKVVLPGHPVSYGSTWQSDEMVRVVTVPVGYGDGYFRSMSNKAEVIIQGERYPVIGAICMDQVMVNIGWESAYNGDEVVLIGSADGETITCEDLAGWAGTNPYEILTNINTRVPRLYISRTEQPGGPE